MLMFTKADEAKYIRCLSYYNTTDVFNLLAKLNSTGVLSDAILKNIINQGVTQYNTFLDKQITQCTGDKVTPIV